jgi:hypothetical protein
MPAKGVKRWCGRRSNERRKRELELSGATISPLTIRGKGGKQRNKSVETGERAVISTNAVAGACSLAPWGCQGLPNQAAGQLQRWRCAGAAEWWDPLSSNVGRSLPGSLCPGNVVASGLESTEGGRSQGGFSRRGSFHDRFPERLVQNTRAPINPHDSCCQHLHFLQLRRYCSVPGTCIPKDLGSSELALAPSQDC